MSSNSNSSFDEDRWVRQIRTTLLDKEEVEEDTINIFNVPKTLMASDPNSYEPQEVALGPYHYWRPKLYEMKRYKLAAAKRTQKQLHFAEFQNLVDGLKKFEPQIRACYHKYLDIKGETLAWMMAVDASFLLNFLQVNYEFKQGRKWHNAIFRDITMLENQIPLFLLKEVLGFQFSSSEAEQKLISMLNGLCKELSPFKKMVGLQNEVLVTNRAHVLDLLYHFILPGIPEINEVVKGKAEIIEVGDPTCTDESKEVKIEIKGGESIGKPSDVKRLFNFICKILLKLNKGPIPLLKKVLLSKPIKLIVKLPLGIISNLPGIKVIKRVLINSFLLSGDKEEEEKSENHDSNNTNKTPLVEEISIPSVTDLAKAGVCFLPALNNGSIMDIKFDVKTAKFYLPVVSLDVNSEVILRNLVAYEACRASGELIFTRYTELMKGIIDTVEDAKLLGDGKIIVNSLKNDAEVAELWNGMSKSVRLTKVPHLDKVIDDVNTYYKGNWRVKVGNFMKVYVFESWQFLTFLAAILMLLLTSVQAFCSVYRCGRIFDYVNNIQ